MHDAAARFDAPRCHRKTRAKYLNQLEFWMLGEGEDFIGKHLIWLYGGAGVGKSAIMHSIVERCTQHSVILGTFFFSRTDPSRNYAEVLITTLAYQLARAFPTALAILEPTIQRDPLIFKASLYTLTRELLVRPVLYLVKAGFIHTGFSGGVFVIDGLDECDDTQKEKQGLVIQIIASILCDHRLPIRFLISSRPEVAITSAFQKEKRILPLFTTISLDDNKDARSDIRQFIQDSFLDILDNHPWRMHIKLPWPSPHSIDALVQKSSGHFIYAATAMKFIASCDEHPPRALEVVNGIGSSRTRSPFAALDALYMHILNSARHRSQVLGILRHCYLTDFSNSVAAVCSIYGTSPEDVELFFSDVQSLVSLSPNTEAEICVRPKHASLKDFLTIKKRSKELFITKGDYNASLLAVYFQFLDNFPRALLTPWVYTSQGGGPTLIWELASAIEHSQDINLLQSLISSHSPQGIWNFYLELLPYDTTSRSSGHHRYAITGALCDYMRAMRDSVSNTLLSI